MGSYSGILLIPIPAMVQSFRIREYPVDIPIISRRYPVDIPYLYKDGISMKYIRLNKG